MDILSDNADQKLMTIASAIGRDPQSWQGWHCLLVKNETSDADIARDCLAWAQAVIESYLKGAEGRIYACANGDIHLLCRNASKNLLEQVGAHIRDYVNPDDQVFVSCMIYDLETDGFTYATNALSHNGDVLSAPKSVFAGLDVAGARPLPDFPAASEIVVGRKGMTKVLLVEDDPVTRWMVRHALKDQCQLATASTANRAFGLYPSWRPDVVFLDINLPDNNGLAVLEWIKRNDPGACVVMFSGCNDMDSISNALESGASGFVSKPFLKENLLHYLRRGARA